MSHVHSLKMPASMHPRWVFCWCFPMLKSIHISMTAPAPSTIWLQLRSKRSRTNKAVLSCKSLCPGSFFMQMYVSSIWAKRKTYIFVLQMSCVHAGFKDVNVIPSQEIEQSLPRSQGSRVIRTQSQASRPGAPCCEPHLAVRTIYLTGAKFQQHSWLTTALLFSGLQTVACSRLFSAPRFLATPSLFVSACFVPWWSFWSYTLTHG